MVNRTGHGSRVAGTVMFLSLVCIPATSGETLLLDDFSSSALSERWFFYGDPLPMTVDSLGLPAPAFCNNGDSNVGSGAVSRETFQLGAGFFAECDVYLTCLERGTWVTACLEIVTPGFRQGDSTEEEYCIARIDLSYSGELDWAAPHRQAVISLSCRRSPEESFAQQYYHQNQLLDGWHRFRLEINDDLTVSYLIDDSLWCVSSVAVPDTTRTVRIRLGDRSSSWGIALHDNVRVGSI
ncbi:MAG: hypothetical protein AVO35_07915 [Candidatus Aegiribacteria sp. MLS_C]|nr:MAG: hypothetical protein AVO35_07915 [Candidatus Aegiribacteria sp. MLS_C]